MLHRLGSPHLGITFSPHSAAISFTPSLSSESHSCIRAGHLTTAHPTICSELIQLSLCCFCLQSSSLLSCLLSSAPHLASLCLSPLDRVWSFPFCEFSSVEPALPSSSELAQPRIRQVLHPQNVPHCVLKGFPTGQRRVRH